MTIDPADLPASVLTAAHLLNYRDIAEREFTREELTDTRQRVREVMRERGIGNALDAIAQPDLLPAASTVKERARLCHAALVIIEEGQQGRETVPTQDAPAADPEKAPAKKKRAKPAGGWVKAIGTNVTAYLVNVGFPDETVLAMLQDGAFRRAASEIKADPAYGWCHVGDPLTTHFEAVPRVGTDTILFGLRRDQKQGVPRTTLRMEAARQAKQEAIEAGKPRASQAREKEIFEDLLARWFREATPQTAVTPITWHPEACRVLIHSDSPKIVAAAVDLFRRHLGKSAVDWDDRAGLVGNSLRERNPAATDVRRSNGLGEGAADIGGDWLLWLVARAENGTGVLRTGEDRIEWWLENDVQLERDTADEKALKVRLAGAPTEGGSFYAALADGASLQLARIALKHVETELTYHVTLDGLTARSWGLPAICVPDGSQESIEAAVLERLALHDVASGYLDALRAAFATDRVDSWSQRVQALRRRLGLELAARYAFDEATGQGVLFREMLPAKQEALFEGQNAETPKPPRAPRGRKARDAAAQADAATQAEA